MTNNSERLVLSNKHDKEDKDTDGEMREEGEEHELFCKKKFNYVKEEKNIGNSEDQRCGYVFYLKIKQKSD